MEYIQWVKENGRIVEVCKYKNGTLIYRNVLQAEDTFSIYEYFIDKKMSVETDDMIKQITYYNSQGREISVTTDYYHCNMSNTIYTDYYDNGIIKYQYKMNNGVKEEIVTSKQILLPNKQYMYQLEDTSGIKKTYIPCCQGWLVESNFDDDDLAREYFDNTLTREYFDKQFHLLKSEKYNVKTGQLISKYEIFYNDKGQDIRTESYYFNDDGDCKYIQEFTYNKQGDIIKNDSTTIINGQVTHNCITCIREYREDGLLKSENTYNDFKGVFSKQYDYLILEDN